MGKAGAVIRPRRSGRIQTGLQPPTAASNARVASQALIKSVAVKDVEGRAACRLHFISPVGIAQNQSDEGSHCRDGSAQPSRNIGRGVYSHDATEAENEEDEGGNRQRWHIRVPAYLACNEERHDGK